MSVGLSFGKLEVLFEIHHLKRTYIISVMEGSLGLEHITKVDALESGHVWKNNI
jgi:hypothetical protein